MVDGKLIYSKKQTGEFPDDHELIEQIRVEARKPDTSQK